MHRVRMASSGAARSAAAATVTLALVAAAAGCAEPVPGALEQVIDGRFARWPGGDAEEGDAWHRVGDATLTVTAAGHLAVEARTDGGVETLVPVAVQRPLRLTFRHKGSAGQLRLSVDDGGDPLTADLPASDRWITVDADVVPARDGVRLRLMDDPADPGPLRIDDVSLAPAARGDTRYEPPIRILLVVHAKAEIDDEAEYWDRRAQIADTVDLAEAHGLRATILLSGPHAEWAVALGDEEFYREIQRAGHEIGTHALPTYRHGDRTWLSGDIFDAGVADTEWGDHRAWVDQLVDPSTNTTVCGYAPMEQMPALMADHGFTLDLSSAAVTAPDGSSREAVAWPTLGHHPHQPFRPADDPTPGHELAGDASAPYVTITHAAQVGRGEAHGMPCAVEDYERYAHLLIDRWTAHQRVAAGADDDLVWVFGVLQHAWGEEDHLDDLAELLDVLDEIALDADSDEGNAVATGATARQVLEEFEAWERAHPDEPGWSFTLPP